MVLTLRREGVVVRQRVILAVEKIFDVITDNADGFSFFSFSETGKGSHRAATETSKKKYCQHPSLHIRNLLIYNTRVSLYNNLVGTHIRSGVHIP